MRDNATVVRIFSFSFGRSNWNCVKGTNDMLSGVACIALALGRPVFHAPWSAVAQIYHLTFCVATRKRTWRLLSKNG